MKNALSLSKFPVKINIHEAFLVCLLHITKLGVCSNGTQQFNSVDKSLIVKR